MGAAAPFFAGCRARFAEAVRRHPGPTHHFALAGQTLTLRFAAQGLAAQFLDSLSLSPAAGPGDGLEIEIWDHGETGVAAPPPAWAPEALAQGGPPRDPDFSSGRYYAWVSQDLRLLWMLDREARRAIVWTRGFRQMPPWELLHPLRGPLHAWLQDRGLPMLHAGSIGTRAGALLVLGRGGSGKSTTVLAGLADGLLSAGDDYVVLEAGTPPRAHALYGTMRLFAEHAARFPGLLPAADHHDLVQGRPKHAAYMGRHRPASLVASLPLVGLLAPRPAPGEGCAAAPIDWQEALAALAPSTLHQLRPDAGALAQMERLCRSLPAWRLTLGDDLPLLPGLLRRLLGQCGAEACHG